jgi:hypothetical protein
LEVVDVFDPIVNSICEGFEIDISGASDDPGVR